MNNNEVRCRHYCPNYYSDDIGYEEKDRINACGLTRTGYHEMSYKKCSDVPDCYFKQLVQLKAENEQLTQKLEKAREDLNTIFTTLEKANNSGLINDTIWVTDLMTLWDLIQQALKELNT